MNYFIDIMEITLPVSALILILALVSPLIKRAFVAKWRYYMWLFISVRILLPFKLFAEKTVIEIPYTEQNFIAANTGAAPAAHGMSLSAVLMWVYLGGMIVFLLIQLLGGYSFFSRVKRWKQTPEEKITDAVRNICEEFGIRREIETVICRAAPTPMMTGLLRPRLILPSGDYSSGELDVILRHELIHYKNHDIFYKLILLLANAVSWFNPFVYLMSGIASRDIELVCDDEAVHDRCIEYRQFYCRTILNMVHRQRGAAVPLSTGFAVSKKAIKERFEEILSERIKKKGILMFLLVAVSVAATGSVISFAKEAVREEIEDKHPIVNRVVPELTPPATATPSEAPAKAEKRTAAKPEIRPAAPAAEESAEEQYESSVPAEASEAPQAESSQAPAKQAEWWNEEYEISRDAIPSYEYIDIGSGEAALLNPNFNDYDSFVTSGLYYVEPGKSMSIYHNGGRIQVADAESGETVHDSAESDNDNVSVITAGENGGYYRMRVSREDGEEVSVYVAEE